MGTSLKTVLRCSGKVKRQGRKKASWCKKVMGVGASQTPPGCNPGGERRKEEKVLGGWLNGSAN